MILKKLFFTACLVLVASFSLVGCDDDETTSEKAAESVEETTEGAADAMEDMGEGAAETIEDMGDDSDE